MNPRPDSEKGLRAEDVTVRFKVPGSGFRSQQLDAVAQASLAVEPGTVVGLVGESGCGKTTMAKTMTGLQRPTAGRVSVGGLDLTTLHGRERQRELSRSVSMIFQDASSSLNPRLSVRASILDPLEIHRVGTRSERDERVDELIEIVGLPPSAAPRLPRELSGGQRQRVAIARALALKPRFVVADEPTSALDISVRAQILNLLVGLRERLGLGMLYISHDIQTVRYLADRIAVMYLGRIVEAGPTNEIWKSPRHPYTRALLSASPSLTEETGEGRIILEGAVPSARNPPTGCPFRTRCWRVEEACAHAFPEPSVENGHRVHCVNPLQEDSQ